VADIDHKHGARLAAEYVQVRDVEANILPGDWRIKVMGHNQSLDRLWAQPHLRQTSDSWDVD
jgi:hypothetical protein